jgi:hypothetical protein
MEEFIAKIKTAGRRFYNLWLNHVNQGNKMTFLNNLPEGNAIIRESFSRKKDLEGHIINYYFYMMKEKEYQDIANGMFWLYRSVIASLSKYYAPSIKMCMTQHYDSANDIIINKLSGQIIEKQISKGLVISTFTKVKEQTKSGFGFGISESDLVDKRCKNLMEMAVEEFIRAIKHRESISFYNLYAGFSIILIKVLIRNADESIPMSD